MDASIFYVDLSAGTVRRESLPEAVYRRYPGGSALATYLLLKHTPPGVDPLGPDNALVFATSPLTGLAISGQSRMSAAARSPLTGGIGDSQCGGYFPAEMKAAGADAIVLQGQAPEPVYLWLKDGQAELRPARHLWGLPTAEAEALLTEELGDARIEVAQAGIAGENGVRFAAIMNMANRANGRTGLGAVMGAKRLKAVAVRGTKYPKPADGKAFKALAARFKENEAANPGIVHFGKYGTDGILGYNNYKGGLPTRNYASGHFPGVETKLGGEVYHDSILKERDTCYACGIRCKRVVELHGEYEVDPVYGGPEYETIATFGSYCGIDDLKAVAKAGELCNKYGMDTISCGATIAWAMDCFERGLLTLAETGGVALRFGSVAAMLHCVEAAARRQGFLGDLLAEGSAAAARRLGRGSEELVVAVKGLEAPAHMPQFKRSLGLIYAVNPFGADHQSSEHDTALRAKPGSVEARHLAELGTYAAEKPEAMSENKVRFAYDSQVLYAALDSLGLCQFVWGPSWQLYGPKEVVELVRAGAGWDVTLAELYQIGERRLNLQRAYNAREGIGREADRLPRKFFQALQGGPTDGVSLSEAEMAEATALYYRMAGWDPTTGMPSAARLAALDLEWIIG